VLQYIASLPEELPTKTKKLLTKSKFLVSDRRFYYLLSKTYVHQTLANFLEDLDIARYGVRVEMLPGNDHPKMLLIVSPAGRANYLRYGDAVYFDVTYNLVREEW
jgi:hypothetical protein